MELQLHLTESEMDDLMHGRTVTHVVSLGHVLVKTSRRSKRVTVTAGSVAPHNKERALFLNLKLENPSNG